METTPSTGEFSNRTQQSDANITPKSKAEDFLNLNRSLDAVEYFKKRNAFTTGPVEVSHMLNDVNLIDVREAKDFAEGHPKGAINLPAQQWSDTSKLSRDKLNILMCYSQVCHLATKAAYEFAKQGYAVMELEGGWKAWKDHDLPTENKNSLN